MAVPRVRNLGLKMVSVVLAVLLWFLVSGEQTVERALRIPLEFTNLPPRLELVGEPPTLVDVRVRGSSGTLSRVAAGDLSAVLDVRTARSGERLFHLTSEDVRAPLGVDIVQVSPASVSLTFEQSVTKTVPVTARVEGKPAAGFVVSGVNVEPPTVVISGPAGAMERVTEAVTEPISVLGAQSSVTETATIGVTNPAVRLSDPRSAKVSVSVTPEPQEWTVSDVTVEIINAGRGASTTPRTVDVRLRGTKDSAASEAVQPRASVDARGLRRGRHTVPVKVDAPAGIGLLGVDPANVVLTIR